MSEERQHELLARPDAAQLLRAAARYVAVAIPDAERRLGSTVGFTILTKSIWPETADRALLSVNIARQVLFTVLETPEPAFRFCVLAGDDVSRARDELEQQGVDVIYRPSALKTKPPRWDIGFDGVAAADAGLANARLSRSLATVARPMLDWKLFHKGWHDPFAARLLVKELREVGDQ